MNVRFIPFVVAALTVWRVTNLFANEDGPWMLLARFRAAMGKIFACFYCLSLWVAIPVALWFRASALDSVLIWLALSGAACLLDRMSPEPVVIEHVPASQPPTLP